MLVVQWNVRVGPWSSYGWLVSWAFCVCALVLMCTTQLARLLGCGTHAWVSMSVFFHTLTISMLELERDGRQYAHLCTCCAVLDILPLR